MNVFSYIGTDAIIGLIIMFILGLFWGFAMGLLRYMVFGTLEGYSPSRGG